MFNFKKIIAILGVLSFFVVAEAHAGEQKIGVLQDQLVLESSLYGKDTNKKVQTVLATKQNELAGKEESLQKKRESYQRDELVLSEKERTDKKQELIKLQRDLQGLAEQYEMEMQDLHQSELQIFRKVVMEELDIIAKKEKIDIVLPQHLTYYYNKTADLTDKVIKALDARYKLKSNTAKS